MTSCCGISLQRVRHVCGSAETSGKAVGSRRRSSKDGLRQDQELSGEISSWQEVYTKTGKRHQGDDLRGRLVCTIPGTAARDQKELLGQASAEPVLGPGELAVRLEYWFSAYKSVWRAIGTRSELFVIKEVIMGICRPLRDI